MMWNYKYIVCLLPLLGLLFSCGNAPEETAPLELRLCLPADGQRTRNCVPGDPGTTETFELPRYLYLFIVKQSGGAWQMWKKEERVLEPAHWVQTRYSGMWTEEGDSIFLYDEPVRFLLNKENPKGRVYALCSSKRLTLSSSMNDIASLDDVLDLQFNTAPDSIQRSLQNIYSTPCNYRPAGSYYCSYDCSRGNSFTVDLLMYHIAAKVDITWYVSPDVRINQETPEDAVRLTYMETRRLFNGNAYCFRPMRNELAAKIGDGQGRDIPDMVTAADEGLWWEGRAYFYTIPYVVTGTPRFFPLQMRMCTNGTDIADAYRPTLNMEIDTAAVFVPWLRANINITAPLEDKEETKTLEI